MKYFSNVLYATCIASHLILTGFGAPASPRAPRAPHVDGSFHDPNAPREHSAFGGDHSPGTPRIELPNGVHAAAQGAITASNSAVHQGANSIAGVVPEPIANTANSGASSISAETAALKKQLAEVEAKNAARSNSAVITGPQIDPTNPAIIKQFELLKDFKNPAGRQQSNINMLLTDSAKSRPLQGLKDGMPKVLKAPNQATHSWINLGAKPYPLRFTNQFLMDNYVTPERYSGFFTRKGPKGEFGYGLDTFKPEIKADTVLHFDVSEKVRVFASLELKKGNVKVNILGVGHHFGGNSVSYIPFNPLK
jgi:hypothetical protein